MCGRYAFYSPHEAVQDVFGPLDGPAVPLPPRWNIAPTQRVAIIRRAGDGRRELTVVQWGLVPSWAKDASIGSRLINARAESLAEKPAFRAAYRRRRCLIPADGYYEWQARAGAKQPYFVSGADGRPFGMAGLWESWIDPGTQEPLESCVIITTDASAAMAAIHSRMPVILPADAYPAWLDHSAGGTFDLSALLAQPGGAAALEAHPVSRRVNNPAADGPELIAAS